MQGEAELRFICRQISHTNPETKHLQHVSRGYAANLLNPAGFPIQCGRIMQV
jgi:hypothetical protein